MNSVCSRMLWCLVVVAPLFGFAWSVSDNGSTVVISNHVGSKNYVFHNEGPDTSIQLQRTDRDGNNVGDAVLLPKCSTVLVGVNDGQTVTISDPADTPDTNGASGTFVPQ